MNVLDATKICVKSLDQNLTVYVNGFCVDKLCDPLINQPIQIESGNVRRGDGGGGGGGENYGPIALGSKLGWIISGPVQVNETEINTSVNFIQAKAINIRFMRVRDIGF